MVKFFIRRVKNKQLNQQTRILSTSNAVTIITTRKDAQVNELIHAKV